MPVTAISSAPSANAGEVIPSSAAQITAANKDTNETWMKILVAQLKNPNPFADSDPTASVTQMAQFQMASQLNTVASLMEKSTAATQVQTATAALGHKVTYLDADGREQVGVAEGVRVTSDGALLKIGDKEIAMSSVRMIQ